MRETPPSRRTLTVVPPLPFKDPLYLSVTPRICATFDQDAECAKLLENEDYQLDETSAKKFLEALRNAGPSVPAIRVTGGKEEPGERWDTWSGQSPREMAGILFAGRDVQFDFEALPFKQLPRQFDTTVFDELPLIRQYVDSLGAEMLIVKHPFRIFRQPRLPYIEDAAPDPLIVSLRPCTPHLQALPVVHDGDPNPKAVPENDDGEWDDEPSLELDMASATPAVISQNVKVILIDPYILIDRDGPLQTALTRIFPPSRWYFSAKELLDLYVEYESLRRAEGQPPSAIDAVRRIARYLGASVDHSTIHDALESCGKPTHYPGGQRLISELVEHGYTPVALPTVAKEAIPQYQGLSFGLYPTSIGTPSQQSLSTLWAHALPFCAQFHPDVRPDQILVVSPDLYRVCEPASKAGFPTAFVKTDGTRSAKLDIPTIAPTYTLGSFHDLLPTLRDPSTSPPPAEPEVSYDNPPFRLKDTYQCTFLLGSGSFDL
ncbi:hypothetical protein EYR36_004134 [Pleurotus pulmonarius]|nr:hypothetical protein EYR36_004134 [Pleurotus pulmonarius]